MTELADVFTGRDIDQIRGAAENGIALPQDTLWLLEQLANEVQDVQMITRCVGEAYDEISFGMFSKPNTEPSAVIDRVNELQDEAVRQAISDTKEETLAEIEALKANLAPLMEALTALLAELDNKDDEGATLLQAAYYTAQAALKAAEGAMS